ncbi:hypothetical protein PLICRDRAFT_52880 [Plicaturopsis crispa FD-325 SS-3]|nr:hypothetical protein PLICRDRAFT_52880 [Plicaturopsis crispa FD-325 SS-3]
MCPPDQWSPNTIENAFKQINPSPTSQHSRSSPEASRPRNPARNAPTNRGGHLQAPTQMYPSRSRGSPRTPVSPFRRQRILFYHKHNPHYGFTNFSAHPVQYKGKTYPTSEHLFQSMKFHDQDDRLAEIMRTCGPRPRQVFECARLYQNYRRPDWFDVNIQKMEEVLMLKFTQHRDLQNELLSTGDAELVEDSALDAFWGIGADGKGSNELGKALERVRARLGGAQASV